MGKQSDERVIPKTAGSPISRPTVDKNQTQTWLQNGDLKRKTESLLTAQYRVLNTNCFKKNYC